MKTIKILFLMLLGVLPVMAQESDPVCYEGTVTDQNGNAIVGANVCLYTTNLESHDRDFEYKGVTDANGNYSIMVAESDKFYSLSVESDGYPDFVMDLGFAVKETVGSLYPAPKDITLWNRLDFKKDKRATIILPEAPDASWGRYYRKDHCEGRTVYFVREESPQANVPYFIFPAADFSIDLSKYDMKNLPTPGIVSLNDETADERFAFCGSYTNMSVLGFVMDDTPDCGNGVVEDGKADYPRVGAFRAYFTSRNSMSVVFEGEPTGISHITSTSMDSSVFDLQGRKLVGTSTKDIFVKNGKKIVK